MLVVSSSECFSRQVAFQSLHGPNAWASILNSPTPARLTPRVFAVRVDRSFQVDALTPAPWLLLKPNTI